MSVIVLIQRSAVVAGAADAMHRLDIAKIEQHIPRWIGEELGAERAFAAAALSYDSMSALIANVRFPLVST